MGIGGWMPLERSWLKELFLSALVPDNLLGYSLLYGNFLSAEQFKFFLFFIFLVASKSQTEAMFIL